jgi:hypothetical protein
MKHAKNAVLSVPAMIIIGLMASAAHADSLTLESFPLNGTIGGTGGDHTIVIDGVACKVKNSTRAPSQGCNYIITGGVEAEGRGRIEPKPKPGENQCSMTCGQ